MQQNKSVGTPPILVLSYKNHAADEFLSDLLKVTGTVLTGNTPLSNLYPGQNVQMVRMGNSGDPNLTQVRRVVIMHDSTMVYIRSQIDVHVCVQMRSIQRKILPNNAVIRTCRQNRVRSVNCRTFVELVNVLHEALLCFKVTRLTPLSRNRGHLGGFLLLFFQTARKLANTAAQRQAAAFPPWPINR